MAANTNPIYGRSADLQVGGAILGSTAVTAQDGTGNLASIYQADAVEGSFVRSVRLKPVGSTAATVARIFVHTTSGAFTPGTTNTAGNTSLFTEVSLPAVTSSNTVAQVEIDIPVNIALNPGYRLLVGFGTSTGAASTGYAVTVVAVRY